MIRFCSFSFLLFFTINYAQLPVTEAASLNNPKTLQMEFGVLYEKLNSDTHNLSLPSSTIHYGLTNKMELFLSNSFNFNVENETSSTNFPLTFGVKTPIINKENTVFSIAGYATFNIEKDQKPTVNPSLHLLYSNQINSAILVEANLGEEYDLLSKSYITNYFTVAHFTIHPKLNPFLEIYGNFTPTSHPHHHLNAGLSYSFNDNFQILGSSGFGLTKNSTRYFIYLGTSILLFDKN